MDLFSYERAEIRHQYLNCTTDGTILLVSEVIGHFKNTDTDEYETAVIKLSTEL